MSAFLLGINYWPRRSAMYMWERFDAGEVREDMARIAALGLRAVRFFLMWETFQPAPNRIDAGALRNLHAVMDALGEQRLLAIPTLFCGHMSGVNWIPKWALDPGTPHGRFRTFASGRESRYGIGDFYSDALLDAQRLFARTAGESLRGHPALHAWDLGNEFSNLREPNTPQEAASWSAVLSHDLHETSGVPVTAGTHSEGLSRDRHVRLSSLCEPFEFATMHGYTVYSSFARNRLDPCVVPFLMQAAQSCAGKPVLFSEFGNPAAPPGTVSPCDRIPLPGEPPPIANDPPANAAPFACLTDTEMPHYALAVLERLHRRGALGALWWCWADYASELATKPPFDMAPHEMRFGIVDRDGNEKPIARALASFAAQKREIEPAALPILDETSYYAGLPQTLSDLYRGYCTLYP